ncbi:FecR family protein [Dinghuibacter silviterrae]|uniref:FecR family protein n=2 Tax=Dinghuibacter silviterrae TaxID=1539049 RepID=A0A4R8DTD3_9BACT|nr:FecR family protein [Dinghuibacter silviterrae]
MAGSASQEEAQSLHDWYRSAAADDVVWVVDGPEELDTVRRRMLERLQREAFGTTEAFGAPGQHGRTVRMRILFSAAAAVLLTLVGVAYFRHTHRPPMAPAPVLASDVLPGGNKATLILGSGQAVTLDSTDKGLLATQGGITVQQSGKGQLVYGGVSDGSVMAYNTILTPNGGTYTVRLSDGSRVWLNAGSSLKYPVRFTGGPRVVDLTGEAYFEVAPAAGSFSVRCLGQTVEVLGTHFNVNAYTNEAYIRTTLLEGKVRVKNPAGSAVLEPGEQSRVGANGDVHIARGIDTAEVMAWKNGMFQFDDADIGTVMRQIGRWYDVDVVYQGRLPDDHFRGKIPRNVNASQALQILATGGIDFTIQGKKIYLK